jgi:glutamine cyclotransferase
MTQKGGGEDDATKRNVRRLCNAMIDFGAPPEIIDEETLLQPGIVTQFGQPPYRIDLLNEIDGVSFAQVWQGAELTSLEGQEVRVIGLKELKANKSATGRKKDREDVRRLNSKRR